MKKNKCETLDDSISSKWRINCPPKYSGNYMVYCDINEGTYDVTVGTYSSADKAWVDYDYYPLKKLGEIKSINVLAWSEIPWPEYPGH